MTAPLAGYHIVMTGEDSPEISEVYWQSVGDAKNDTAGMQIAIDTEGGKVLSVLTVDYLVAAKLFEQVPEKIGALVMAHIDIIDL